MSERLKRFGRMRRTVAVSLIALVAALCPTPASAGPADRIEEQLRRTDQALENAESLVNDARSQRAREVLDLGRRIQGQAWENFRAARLVVSGKLTLEARTLAMKASSFARGDAGLKSKATRELEVAESMLGDAREQVASSRNETGLRLLDEAAAQVDRARTQIGEQHYEAGFRLALSAQRLIRQAVDLGDIAATPHRLERELDRTDGIIERAREPVQDSNDEAAHGFLERAVEMQSNARAAHAAAEFRAALRSTREARGMATRALARVRGPVDENRVRDEIGRTDDALDRAKDDVEDADDANAVRMLETARSHQDRARELLEKKDFRTALAQTLVARRLALRASKLAGSVAP